MRILFISMLLSSFVWATGSSEGTGFSCNKSEEKSSVFDSTPGLYVSYGSLDSSKYNKITIDVSGIVDEIDTNVCFRYYDGVLPSCTLFQIKKDSSSTIAMPENMNRISLRNFQAYYDDGNLMSKILDSAWIYISKNADLKLNDTIYIKNYSAILFESQQSSCASPVINISGEVTVNPKELPTVIKKRSAANAPFPKFHNRDVKGKFLNNCDARKAKY